MLEEFEDTVIDEFVSVASYFVAFFDGVSPFMAAAISFYLLSLYYSSILIFNPFTEHWVLKSLYEPHTLEKNLITGKVILSVEISMNKSGEGYEEKISPIIERRFLILIYFLDGYYGNNNNSKI